MSDQSAIDYQARLKEALVALKKVRTRLETVERQRSEPIAIIGIGCRYPGGVHDLDSFWQLLRNGVDAIREVPADRWSLDEYYDPERGKAGKVYTRFGGFLDSVDQFDPIFFGISPREANSMDPQQRLILEVAWEALENAEQAPDQLAGSATGVFVGATISDYLQVQARLNSPERTGTYRITGNFLNSIAGRVSYTLGLRGPAMLVDTACSSSLVAIHQAIQSLRNGETNMALAGGVNLILSPETSISACQASMLAPDGRCKTFDSRADGFIRSEGAGIVVLKRLSDALEHGDHIWAVIRGSAVNHDGASSGFSVPSKAAQEDVIRTALQNANVSAEDIAYIEAHGTGTSLGDPIEVRALEAALGSQRSANSPLLLGSVKTNFGHTESAAGVAGLIKTVLALHHQEIPPHLHLNELNSFMDWSKANLAVPTKSTPFPSRNGKQLAGISSFGVSGINAHIIVEAAPAPAPATKDSNTMERPLHLLRLSAQVDTALRASAERFAAYIQNHPDISLKDLAFSANTGRANFRHQLAVTAATSADMATQLLNFVKGDESPAIMHGVVEADSHPKIAFLFTGHGSQYVNMGRGLYETSPIFYDAVQECEVLLQPYLDVPISKVMYPTADEVESVAGLWDGMKYTQPAQFVLAYALAKLWKSWGIQPGAVIGHSVGEYAAACAAGIMDLADGIKLVAARGRLMEELPQRGVMAAVFAEEAVVAKAIAPYANELSIAVINGPTNVVISGTDEAVTAVLEEFTRQEINSRRLDVAQASHSPIVDPMLDEFERIAKTITYRNPATTYISCLTGKLANGNTEINADYWRTHQRQGVKFAQGIQSLIDEGFDHFVEIGPAPALIGIVQRNLDGAEDGPITFPSLRKGYNDWELMLSSLGSLYVHGAAVDWQGLDQPYARKRIPLPSYAFQRQRYWVSAGPKQQTKHVENLHPLLGTRVRSALQDMIFENELSSQAPAFLADHVVQEQVIVPATAYMEILLAAGRELLKSDSLIIDDLVIHTPLKLVEEATAIQTIVNRKSDREIICQVFSHDRATDQWQLHVTAVVGVLAEGPGATSLTSLKSRCKDKVSVEEHYQRLEERGLSYGAAFRGMTSLSLGKNEAFARIEASESVVEEIAQYRLHPALLDAALQAVTPLLPQGNKTYLPMSVEAVKIFGHLGSALWSHATLKTDKPQSNGILKADIKLYDDNGQLVVALVGFTMKEVAQTNIDSWLYEVKWQKSSSGAAITADELAGSLQASLTAMTEEPKLVSYQREFLPRMDALCAALVQNALLDMGWVFEQGSTFSLEEISTKLNIAKQHQSLFRRLLEILEEDGAIARQDDCWAVVHPLVKKDVSTEVVHLLSAHPEAAIEVNMVARIGRELGPALQGQRDPLELLFPGGSLDETENLYREAPFTVGFNQLMGQAVQELAKSWKESRPLRVLEIGAGTGGTTSYVLSQFSGAQAQYTFTDVSPLFLNRAREKFAAYDFVRYQTLDIDKDPVAQGFETHNYDLILATNVLHATSDMHQTLKRVRDLLAPDGLLLAIEGTRKQRFADIIVGLTPGWWLFSDKDRRPDYALLSQSQWLKLFEETGFVSAQGLAGQDVMSNQSLLIAQAGQVLSMAPAGSWLVFAETHTLGGQLADRLRSQDQTVHIVQRGDGFIQNAADSYQVNPTRADDFRQLIQSAKDISGIVYLWALEHPVNSDEVQSSVSGGLLSLTQALVAEGQSCPVWVVTQGAQAADRDVTAPHQATLWGMSKVINQEHPELSVRVIDLDPKSEHEQLDNLWAELANSELEEQVAFHAKERFVPRLVRAAAQDLAPTSAEPVRLTVSERGIIDNLRYEKVTRKAPGPDELEIQVLATGIGFRDVLNTLGMYPGGGELGAECAGVVTAIGANVENVQVGDAVIAMAVGSYASYVITPAKFVVRKPAQLSFAEAASIPSAFLTTQYALHTLAKMKTGDRVLIHAAAGGVGLAAIQMAQQAGAEIFGTAGSPSKREMLKSLGVQHVMDSRTHDFAEEIMQITNGKGVDIVLNSLADEFIAKSVSALAEDGRFIEIGKRGIWSKEQFASVRPNAFYATVDLLIEANQNPDLIANLFAEIMPSFENGTFKPLPLHVYPASEVIDVFRLMAQGKHTGKLVIAQEPQPFAVREQATYLVTGGLGGLGLAVAEWLAAEGARHLVLVGRSTPQEQARAILQKLTESGVEVKVVQADVSKREAMQDLFAEIALSMPPLKGVVHAAGALDDGILTQQTWDRFAKVYASKVQGSWNLHELTKGMALDFFVLFSSAVSLLGSAGQANHVAACTFQDMLAHYRRSQGLPALSIGWGPWAQIGAAAEREVLDRLLNRGIETIPPAQGIESLAKVMRASQRTHVGVVPVNWTRFMSQSTARFYAEMKQQVKTQSVRAATSVSQAKEENGLWKRLESAPESKRKNILLEHVREQALKVLNLPADYPLEQRQPLQELGLDSLMAVELRNRLGKGLPLSRALPATLVFDYPTPEALSRYLMETLFAKEQKKEAPAQPEQKVEVAINADLSDEEAEALLLAELNELQQKKTGKS